MATKRRTRGMKPTSIPPALYSYFQAGRYAEDDEGAFEVFILSGSEQRLQATWGDYRDQIMAEWIKKNPGCRPWAWWALEAPKEAVAGWTHERFNSAQRQRLGGIGTPMHEVTCSWGGFDKGIPVSWAEIDPEDPPTYESESAFLQRHGLLTEPEKKYLQRHPELMEPETVTLEQE